MLVLPCVWWKLSEALDAQEALLGRAEHAVRLSVNTALKHKNQTLLYYPHLTKIKQTIIDGKHQLYNKHHKLLPKKLLPKCTTAFYFDFA